MIISMTRFRVTLVVILMLLIHRQLCLAQSDINSRGNLSFSKLPDGVIKKEIAFFALNPTLENENAPKQKVNEFAISGCTNNSAILSKGEMKIFIEAIKFDTSKHKLSYEQTYLRLIDGKPFWGEDGGLPKRRIKSVVYSDSKIKIILPERAISDLYNPNFCYKDQKTAKLTGTYCKAFISEDGKRVYIYMMNSDGAGGYEVTWVIQDNKYLTRVVDFGF